MKTSSSYHGFAMLHEELNNEIVQRVLTTASVEKLYLLGLTMTDHRTETLFSVQSTIGREVAHCFLLALVAKEDDHSLNNLQDKLENNLLPLVPVTVLVFPAVQFANWLVEGHPFAAAVCQKAYSLFQKNSFSLPEPMAVKEEVVKKEAEQLFNQTKTRVKEFLAGAELYTIRVQYKMAAFMLHQAAEQSLRAMLINHTGLRINTHSIDKLIRLCTMFCYELPAVFPRRTEKEKRLFQLLQKAYIDTRYKEDYSIKLEELQSLTVSVTKVVNLFAGLKGGLNG